MPESFDPGGDLKEAAKRALIARLKLALPPERVELVDSTGRTERFEDNVVGSLSNEQIAQLGAQLAAGDGGELKFGPDGSRPDAHAAHSSAALALNSFGAWLGRERDLVLCGIRGFDAPLRVEAKQPIFQGGKPPNLDCLLSGPGLVVGVESKLTEPLKRRAKGKWSKAYSRDSCRALLKDGWLSVFEDSMSGAYRSEYLDVDQLIKHALGLSRQHPESARYLVYVYWEPTDADRLEWTARHHAEAQELLGRVGNSEPRLHVVTHQQVWEEWRTLPGAPWIREHIELLLQRYSVAIYEA